jgi:hypothetical protein
MIPGGSPVGGYGVVAKARSLHRAAATGLETETQESFFQK